MKLGIYNAEVFERGPRWYITFSVFFTFFIIVLLLSNNYIGVITLCFFLGGYMVFSIATLETTDLELKDNYLRVGKKTYARGAVQGFVIEIHKHTADVKNIVLLIEGAHYIYTIADTPENTPEHTRDFLLELNKRTELFNSYGQTTLQLFLRKLKI